MSPQVASGAGYNLPALVVQHVASPLPISFNGGGGLFGLDLFLMAASMCLGLMMAGRMASVIWRCRRRDRPRHPVTIWRIAWLLAGSFAFLRCGTKAMKLWAWDPADPMTTARSHG